MRAVTVFFYGLFMDEALLRRQGLAPSNRRLAVVEGYDIHIGKRASMAPKAGASVWGIAFDLAPTEIARLYGEPPVRDYWPEAVLARQPDGIPFAALCYTIEAAAGEPANRDYAETLGALAARLDLPEAYRQRLARFRA